MSSGQGGVIIVSHLRKSTVPSRRKVLPWYYNAPKHILILLSIRHIFIFLNMIIISINKYDILCVIVLINT